jgi:V8-like Glu-specific endopeptidase
VTVCGYKETAMEVYHQMTHSNHLQYFQHGGRYDIDTDVGQSGSPVYYMSKMGEENVAHVIGIHKGYDRKGKLNICTLITEEVITRLREWMTVMGIAFRVSGPEKKKEAMDLQHKIEEKERKQMRL